MTNTNTNNAMIPPTLLRKLAWLRWRERWLRLAWGGALAVTLAALVLASCCLADWIIDLDQDTPAGLRRAMLLGQVILWGTAASVLAGWALFRRMSDDELALFVEERVPEFAHRLISALQLNRPGANVQGMSSALIAAATREAEQQALQYNFASLADHRRIQWAGGLLLALLAVTAGVYLIAGDTMTILIARQFGSDREIPRSVAIDNLTKKVWPSGEEVTLTLQVRGKDLSPDIEGTVRIDLDDQTQETYPLVFQALSGPNVATYTARVRPLTVGYQFRGWLRDGRTRRPYRVQLEPRPAIVKLEAWLQLPEYTGRRPNGQPYEMLQPRGDIAGIPGTSARIAIQTQKPIESATIELLGKPGFELLAGIPVPGFLVNLYPWLAFLKTPADAPGPDNPALAIQEIVRRKVTMTIGKDGQHAEAVIDLRPGESAYRIEVADQYGFTNSDPPRRNIRLENEEPPVVTLLPERFPVPGMRPTDDDDVEGVPILENNRFRIAYTCSTPYGLREAQICYLINGKGPNPQDPSQPWILKLTETMSTEETGPFDPVTGAFTRIDLPPLDQKQIQVMFHRVPSPDLDRVPPGTDGGGRYDFQTRGILKKDDKIEYWVEVFDRNPAKDRPPGRSEVRQKTVVSLEQYLAWLDAVAQEESRIRQLENRQRSVFGANTAVADLPPGPTPGNLPQVGTTLRPPASSFVRSWQIIGPFPNTADGAGFDAVYPVEAEEKIELSREYNSGIKGAIRWKLHNSSGDRIDLEKVLQHSDAGVAYAVCWFRSDREAKAILATGSDDGMKVWIDRKLIHSIKTRREAIAGEDKVPVMLSEDNWHELLVKVDNRTGSWAFYLQLLDAETGKPLNDVRFRTTPPGDEGRTFVRQWLIVGPFPSVGERGRDTVFPPETQAVDLGRNFDGIGGKVRWKEHRSDTNKIDLGKWFDRPFNESNIAYAVCWVKRPDGKSDRAVLATGSDDGIKVWINRQLRIDAAVNREANPGSDTQEIRLRRGWNEVLVKVDNRFGRWAFFLEFRDPETGTALEGLEVRTTPPPDE